MSLHNGLVSLLVAAYAPSQRKPLLVRAEAAPKSAQLGEPLAAIKVGDMYRKSFPKDEVVPGLL